MSKNSRQIVRKPATKFPKLQKKLQQAKTARTASVRMSRKTK